MKKFTSIMLLVAMLASLTACGKTTETKEADPQAIDTSPAAEETSSFVNDDLPDTLDFSGETVDFQIGDYLNAFWNDFYAEAITGERINDTIFSMIDATNQRLNISLNLVQTPVTVDHAAFGKQVTSAIMAGDDSYDVVGHVYPLIAEQMTNPYFVDLSKVNYIDFSKPWWNSTAIQSMPTDSIHFATGDGTLAAIKHTMCVFFNQSMILSNTAIETDMYELVENGNWTLDKLSKYSELFYIDSDGNGDKNFGDTFGLTFGDTNKYLGFINSLDVRIAIRTEDGYEIQYGSERAHSAYERMCKLIHENIGVWRGQRNTENVEMIASGGGNYVSTTFIEGNSAFMCGLVQDATTVIPSISFDYGILPYPKLDATQSDYISTLQRNFYFLIPSTASNIDASCAFLEAWSSLAYRQLQPEYFETTLKSRYSAEESMSRMYDILRETLILDVGLIFTDILGNPRSQFREYIIQNQTNWTSYIASNMEKWETALAELEIKY